jgi:uncharacterized membrane protein (UPF0127 family)
MRTRTATESGHGAAAGRIGRWALLALLLACTGRGARADESRSPMVFFGWPRAVVVIQTRGGEQRLATTVADSPARQEQGLMFVRVLAADESMWFPQRTPRLMGMWMKNTLIPLDMLFVDARGRIACIAARTTPESEAIISCPEEVSGVLEIGGGEAARRGIRPGDRVALVAP